MDVEEDRYIQPYEDKRILIMGGLSYVGRHLFARLGSQKAKATYYNRSIKNGIYFDAVSMHLSDVIKNPEEISHAVILFGDTNPETCAADVNKSYILNVDSIKKVIDCLKQWHIKPIFASSDYIFDGRKGNYIETDLPNPILVYGKQKVEIEEYLRHICDDYIIVRFSKIFGSQLGDGTIFTKWLDVIEQTDTIQCPTDQIFSPVYINDVVESIIRLIVNNCKGIFHVSSGEPFARIELLKMLLNFVNKYPSVNIRVKPCSIHDFKLREKRPLNVSMIPDKLIKATGIKLTEVESICKKIVEMKFQKKDINL